MHLSYILVSAANYSFLCTELVIILGNRPLTQSDLSKMNKNLSLYLNLDRPLGRDGVYHLTIYCAISEPSVFISTAKMRLA